MVVIIIITLFLQCVASLQLMALSPWQERGEETKTASHLEMPPTPEFSVGRKCFPRCSPAQVCAPYREDAEETLSRH